MGGIKRQDDCFGEQVSPGVNSALFVNLHLRTLELVELFADGRLEVKKRRFELQLG